MENTIQIHKNEITIKEYNGQRVVTFKDIDCVHNRPNGTARKRFNDNRKRFLEGEDFYRIQLSEIRTVGIKSPNGGIVVTESGYLMLVKSFTDDLAWDVQRQLVNCYFRVKEAPQSQHPEPKYAPTRPLTSDDYIAVGKSIAQCDNERLAIVLDMFRKAGFDIPEISEIREGVGESDDFVKLLNQYGLKELCEKPGICKSSLYYYRIGKFEPRKSRKEEIIKILTQERR